MLATLATHAARNSRGTGGGSVCALASRGGSARQPATAQNAKICVRVMPRNYGLRPIAAAICFSITPVDTQSVRLSLRGSGESSRPGYVASTLAAMFTELAPADDVVATVTVSVDTRFVSASDASANLHVM